MPPSCSGPAAAPRAAARARRWPRSPPSPPAYRSALSFQRRSSIFEPVAELLDRDDRVRQQRELLAKPPDVNVDGARAAGVLVAPHVAEEQIARQHPAAVLEQVLQQQEFLGGEPHFRARDLHRMAFDVDRQWTVSEQ